MIEKIVNMVLLKELRMKEMKAILRQGREDMNGALLGILISIIIIPCFILSFPIQVFRVFYIIFQKDETNVY